MITPRASRSARPFNAMAIAKDGDRAILPCELARQGVDLGLPLCGKRCKMCAIALEKRPPIKGLAAPIAGALRLQPRNQRRHVSYDLPIDHVELALRLPARLLHAEELDEGIERNAHDDASRRQPMKSDGPS